MIDALIYVVISGLGVSAITMALTKSKAGAPWRALVQKLNVSALTYMVGCPFCTGFWLSMAWMFGGGLSLDLGLAIWAVQTLFVGLMMRALFIHEAEIEMMQNEINELKEQINGNS